MNTQTITVIAKLKAKKGKEEALKQTLLLLLEKTREENGCINYDLHVSDHDKRFFMLYEKWESTLALSKHMSTNHFRDILKILEEIIAEPMDVTLWEKIK